MMERKNMTALESVGTGIDTDGMTYVMLEGGGYDWETGCHLRDIENGDWFCALSAKDRRVVDAMMPSELRNRVERLWLEKLYSVDGRGSYRIDDIRDYNRDAMHPLGRVVEHDALGITSSYCDDCKWVDLELLKALNALDVGAEWNESGGATVTRIQ